MTYLGTIKNGVAVLNPPASLPEGTPVRIQVEAPTLQSWSNKSIEELAQEQGVKAVTNLDDLKSDWPEDESIDEFLALIREVRR